MTKAKSIPQELETYLVLNDRVLDSKKQNDAVDIQPPALKEAYERAGVKDHIGVTISIEEGRLLGGLMFRGADVTQKPEDAQVATQFNEQLNDLRNNVITMSAKQMEQYLHIAGAAVSELAQLNE